MTSPLSFAERTERERGSVLSRMYRLARETPDAIRLEVGEPDFDTPARVVEEAAEAAAAGATHYTPVPGLRALREAIAGKTRRQNGMDGNYERVLVTTGASEALMLAMQTVVDPGQSVVIPTPAWTSYAIQATAAGGEPIHVPLSPDDDFRLATADVIDAIDDDTAAVVLCSPSNPTGVVYDREAVRSVVAAAADHDAIVIADEVYERITFAGSRESVRAVVDDPRYVISVNSFSKGFAMTGWRLGWLVANPAVVERATRLRLGTTLCPSSVAQQAGLAALSGDQGPFEEMVAAYERRRNRLLDAVATVPDVSVVRPEGAFYAFVDVRSLDGTSFELARELLDECGVATAPGSAFGEPGEGHLRFSFAATDADVDRGLRRFASFVRERV